MVGGGDNSFTLPDRWTSLPGKTAGIHDGCVMRFSPSIACVLPSIPPVVSEHLSHSQVTENLILQLLCALLRSIISIADVTFWVVCLFPRCHDKPLHSED